MLAYLEGIVKERQNGEMILKVGSEANGFVGYQVKVPDHPRYEIFIPGQRAEVYLYTHVREDAFDLYGFLSTGEKNLYTTLLQVSGVGPKLAISLLSHTDEATLIDMILSNDKEGLTGFSGVGKKTAERIILDLKDVIQKKLDAGLFSRKTAGKTQPGKAGDEAGNKVDRSSRLFMEAYLALQGLGYKDIQARQMIEATLKNNATLTKVEDLIKVALQGNF